MGDAVGAILRGGFAVVVLGVAVASGCGAGVEGRARAPRRLDLHVGSPGKSSLPTAAARGDLAAGTYYTSQLRSAVRFNVPDGWALEAENSSLLYLRRGTDPSDILEIYVFIPGDGDPAVGDPPLANDAAARTPSAPFPKDYVAYLAASAYLEVGPVTPAELFGRHGTSVDAVVSRTPTEGVCIGRAGSCFSLFRYGADVTSEQFEVRGAALRVWSLDRPAGPVILVLAAPSPERLAAASAELNAVLDSVRFL